MKCPPALEVTLLEPRIVSRCPAVCCFNGTCPERVQAAAEQLWMDGSLTPQNYRTACYRFPYLAEAFTGYTGLIDLPTSAEGVREVLIERLAIVEPADVPVRLAAQSDAEALALQEKVLKLRDAARQRRDAATKAAFDAAHPQQELGV